MHCWANEELRHSALSSGDDHDEPLAIYVGRWVFELIPQIDSALLRHRWAPLTNALMLIHKVAWSNTGYSFSAKRSSATSRLRTFLKATDKRWSFVRPFERRKRRSRCLLSRRKYWLNHGFLSRLAESLVGRENWSSAEKSLCSKLDSAVFTSLECKTENQPIFDR